MKLDCCSLCNLNPKNCEVRDVAKNALTVFVCSLLLLTVASLSHHYPAASGAFLTIFALGTGVSFLVFVVSAIKCSRNAQRNQQNLSEPVVVVVSQSNSPLKMSQPGTPLKSGTPQKPNSQPQTPKKDDDDWTSDIQGNRFDGQN